MGALEHGVRLDHVLKDVVHGDDVVSSDMVGKVRGLERTFEDVVAPSPALRSDVRLDLNPRAFQVQESAKFVKVSTITSTDVEDAPGMTLDQTTVEAGSRPGPELHQQPCHTAVVLVVGVIVAWIEWRQFRFQGTRSKRLRSAVGAFLHHEVTSRYNEVLEIGDIGPIQPGAVRAADRALDWSDLVRVRRLRGTAKR